MTSHRDPRGYLHWIVWARMHGESDWVCPAATYTEADAWDWASKAVDAQEGVWEFTVRHLTTGPPPEGTDNGELGSERLE